MECWILWASQELYAAACRNGSRELERWVGELEPRFLHEDAQLDMFICDLVVQLIFGWCMGPKSLFPLGELDINTHFGVLRYNSHAQVTNFSLGGYLEAHPTRRS